MNIDKETVARLYANGGMSKDDFDILMADSSTKRSKFNARRTEVDGITFDSKAESRRFSELKLLEKAGEIRGLKCQVKFKISVNGHLICHYICDFEYWETNTEKHIVEDCKGVRTPVYRLKKKLMLAIYRIEIKETK